MVRKRGEVVLVGAPWRRYTELHAHDLVALVFRQYVLLRSGWEWEVPYQSVDFQPHSIFSGFRTALRWLQQGKVPLDGLSTLVSPTHAQSAYQDLLHNRAKTLFTLFDWTHSGEP